VPINNLMEDAATAEISRAQIWQWVHHEGGVITGGPKVTVELFRSVLAAEVERLQGVTLPGGATHESLQRAARLLDELTSRARFEEFLTVSAYSQLD
jgi:malate synthase